MPDRSDASSSFRFATSSALAGSVSSVGCGSATMSSSRSELALISASRARFGSDSTGGTVSGRWPNGALVRWACEEDVLGFAVGSHDQDVLVDLGEFDQFGYDPRRRVWHDDRHWQSPFG